jgi:hypothetical protein
VKTHNACAEDETENLSLPPVWFGCDLDPGFMCWNLGFQCGDVIRWCDHQEVDPSVRSLRVLHSEEMKAGFVDS